MNKEDMKQVVLELLRDPEIVDAIQFIIHDHHLKIKVDGASQMESYNRYINAGRFRDTLD